MALFQPWTRASARRRPPAAASAPVSVQSQASPSRLAVGLGLASLRFRQPLLLPVVVLAAAWQLRLLSLSLPVAQLAVGPPLRRQSRPVLVRQPAQESIQRLLSLSPPGVASVLALSRVPQSLRLRPRVAVPLLVLAHPRLSVLLLVAESGAVSDLPLRRLLRLVVGLGLVTRRLRLPLSLSAAGRAPGLRQHLPLLPRPVVARALETVRAQRWLSVPVAVLAVVLSR
jgi:hypothetical protein